MNEPHIMQLTDEQPSSVTQVLVDATLTVTYTGSIVGTGVVTVSMPVVNALAGQTLMNVITDRFGRVIGGTPTGLNDYILNQSTFQDAHFNVRSGTLLNLTIEESLNLVTPLGVTSGGSGVSSVAPHQVFIGDVAVTGAPGWRTLADSDMPSGVLNSEIPTATDAILGLVRVGSGIQNTSGLISVPLCVEIPSMLDSNITWVADTAADMWDSVTYPMCFRSDFNVEGYRQLVYLASIFSTSGVDTGRYAIWGSTSITGGTPVKLVDLPLFDTTTMSTFEPIDISTYKLLIVCMDPGATGSVQPISQTASVFPASPVFGRTSHSMLVEHVHNAAFGSAPPSEYSNVPPFVGVARLMKLGVR